MMKIDAIGDACPLPVIKAKKALRESDEISIRVDNEIATQNLSKMANQLGLQVNVEQKTDEDFQVRIFPEDSLLEDSLLLDQKFQGFNIQESSYIVVINAKTMGKGDDELGLALMKGFVYSLTEQDILPTHIIFYNGGAWLTTGESEVLDDLKMLEEASVEILTCGACLDFFGLTHQLAVGEVTNMYHIITLMTQFHVVKP